ncbi:conserved hypothetical protein [Shewanella denitrificans OS217]|uniref:DUF3626 domain-containing protein n=1 Tax=Shewanella denitrificans (strain OS217 / ATCC BAA-1090 / DSM 15013) TaxID=318161 RepID=Q12JS3_SHEDO|nr:DUF3626 domain-containing protein [Shewanella denitrificans]ABE56303.1 conserved hypothetical protein [Shewanella denitrificans OS217]
MTSKLAAVSHIEKIALGLRDQAHAVIKNILMMSDIPTQELQHAMKQLSHQGRVALHFHPDRIDNRGLTVVQGLLRDGIYKSQFETHISNGQLSPELGGPRDHWENQLFGNSYSGIKSRPKYGALDLGLCPLGPAPRFGSCYFLTHSQVLSRCTFSYMDSYRLPKEKGTLSCFDAILAALLSESFERCYALGRQPFKPRDIMAHMACEAKSSVAARFELPGLGNLDHYIEAQIHGDVSLADDIGYLVADPSFKGTETEEYFNQLCSDYQINLHWHNGLTLACDKVPTDFRGAAMPVLAKQIAIDEVIDAKTVGAEAARLQKQPSSWSERGSQAKKTQELKLLWHVLVRFGKPREDNFDNH